MARWELLDTDVHLSHQLPAFRGFMANVYECTSCHNKENDLDGLPDVCPWCGALMDNGKPMRIHPWLPERTSWGEPIRCDNCKHFGEPSDHSKSGRCGQTHHICGNWEEAEEVQMQLGGIENGDAH